MPTAIRLGAPGCRFGRRRQVRRQRVHDQRLSGVSEIWVLDGVDAVHQNVQVAARLQDVSGSRLRQRLHDVVAEDGATGLAAIEDWNQDDWAPLEHGAEANHISVLVFERKALWNRDALTLGDSHRS